LLVAAADPTGDLALLWRAAQRLGIPESAAHTVESDGLLVLGEGVVFRHPLVRSARSACAGVGTNAACAVVFVDGRVVWPRYNPVAGLWAPEPDAPRLSRPGGGHRLMTLAAALWAGALMVVGTVAARIGPEDGAAPSVLRVVLVAGLAVIPVVATRWRLHSRRRSG
jgi:hypothetical protein